MNQASFFGVLVAVALPFTGIGLQPSTAQEGQQLIAQRINCTNPNSTVEINECSRRDAAESDRKLNQVYQQLRPRLVGQQRQRLTDAQLTWIKFRDTTCEYERGEWGNGTGAPYGYSICLDRVTRQRTEDLERYLERINQ
jgi:uncharacterized protein YecT (DUF1311 family)